MQCKQCSESKNVMSCVFFLLGNDHQTFLSLSSDQSQVFREHGLWEDSQTGPIRAVAVCCPHRAYLCHHGEVWEDHPWGERWGSHGLLVGGGRLHRLRDLCDSACVGPCQIPEPKEEGVHLRDHTVVSTGFKMWQWIEKDLLRGKKTHKVWR